jgi:hypothetical protein
MQSSNEVAAAAGGLSGDRAGVDDNQIGALGIGDDLVAGASELTSDCFYLGSVKAAAE